MSGNEHIQKPGRVGMRLLVWLPLLVFVLATAFVVGAKYTGAGNARDAARAPGTGPDCAVICETVARCSLEVFGDTPENRGKVPALQLGCAVGCTRQRARIEACFAGTERRCGPLTLCVFQALTGAREP